MQTKRILSGGLAAAAVMVAGQFAIESVIAPVMERSFSRLGLPVPGESALLAGVAMLLILALISVCLYSALSEVFGPGVSTAAQTGVMVWTLSCLLPTLTMYVYGIVDASFFWLATGLPLVQTVAATVVGGLVYDGRKGIQAHVIPKA